MDEGWNSDIYHFDFISLFRSFDILTFMLCHVLIVSFSWKTFNSKGLISNQSAFAFVAKRISCMCVIKNIRSCNSFFLYRKVERTKRMWVVNIFTLTFLYVARLSGLLAQSAERGANNANVVSSILTQATLKNQDIIRNAFIKIRQGLISSETHFPYGSHNYFIILRIS